MGKRASQNRRRQQGRRSPATDVTQEGAAPRATPGAVAHPERPADTATAGASGGQWLNGRRGLVITVLLVLLVLGGPTLVREVRWRLAGIVPPPAGLVFIRGAQLLLIALESRAERLLAQAPAAGTLSGPVASREGGRLAYTVARGEYGDPEWGGSLFTLDLPPDGTQPGQPRELLKPEEPGSTAQADAWSPDGRALLLTYHRALWNGESYQGTRPELQVLEESTGKRTTIVEDAQGGAWSPDGKRIAYVRSDGQGRQSLWIARPDGSEARQVTGDGEFVGLTSTQFSTDSTRLLFAGVPGTISRSGSGERTWLDTLRPAVAEAHGVPWDLWAWEDGQKPRQLTRLGQDLLSAAWSPDSTRIAVVSDVGLYSMEANGEDLKRVELQADPRGLAWLER